MSNKNSAILSADSLFTFMARSYKVFFREKIIFLTSDETLVLFDQSSLSLRYDTIDSLQITFQSFLTNPVVSKLFVVADDYKKLWNDFKSLFEIIEAAGGVVKNSKDEILFIFRNEKWDLPKGKIEMKEKVTDAAVREVEEECGISGAKIVKEIIATYHIYFLDGKSILKKTHWFEMRVKGTPDLKPQKEEGITIAKWLNENKISEVIKNTYPSIVEILSSFNSKNG